MRLIFLLACLMLVAVPVWATIEYVKPCPAGNVCGVPDSVTVQSGDAYRECRDIIVHTIELPCLARMEAAMKAVDEEGLIFFGSYSKNTSTDERTKIYNLWQAAKRECWSKP